MKIMLSGSHGLIGTELKKRLTLMGHQVEPLGRDLSLPINFKGIDSVIHLAGEPIATGRWTNDKKNEIRESRVLGTHQLSQQIASSSIKPAVYISASAIGYYGDRADKVLTEKDTQGMGFLPTVCKAWERESTLSDCDNLRTVQLRTGIVLSEKGGALKSMLLPYRLGCGGKLGNGEQYMSWISLSDLVNAILYILTNSSLNGPVNVVAPNPVKNREFSKTLAYILRRPEFMPLPRFALKLIFGEMAESLLLSSSRVVPEKLLRVGYRFEHEHLKEALEDILR